MNPMSKRLVVDVPANVDVQLDVADVRRADRLLLENVHLRNSTTMSRQSQEDRMDLVVGDVMEPSMTR